MASSAALTTTHLPRLRNELEEWRKKQRAPSTFVTPLSDITNRFLQERGEVRGKDVIVAFRTRPPLEHEAEEKFKAYEGKDSTADTTEDSAPEEPAKVEFCAGITVADAEPGTFIAHVPGYKVRALFPDRCTVLICWYSGLARRSRISRTEPMSLLARL